jgi:tetratricopeptide (TPR) repeat protein
VVRLFPRRSDIRFLGCVHESVEESLARTDLQIKTSGLVLHHYGQVRAPERMRRKKQFYLELGLRKLEKNPSLRAQFELGIQYQELGYFEQAIPHFLEAVHHESTEFRIADLYLGICFSKIGKLADARFHLSRARDRHPGSACLLCELGLVNAKEGKVPEAIAAFKQALAIDAEHVAALCYLGSLLVGEDQAVEGTGLLEKAVQIDSNHFDSWINLAAAYQKVGRPSFILNCLERACALKPENSDVARRLARAYADAGRYTDAAQILNQAVNRDPGDERLKMYWAALLSMSGQEDQGRNVYESILRTGGKFAGLAQRQLEKMNTRMTAVRPS